MGTCEVHLADGAIYELTLDENQLRRRDVGDLITCEITAAKTPGVEDGA